MEPISTTDKMGRNRKIRLKDWCGMHDELWEPVPKFGRELDDEETKEDKLGRLIHSFSSKKTEDDTVDINIDDRLLVHVILNVNLVQEWATSIVPVIMVQQSLQQH